MVAAATAAVLDEDRRRFRLAGLLVLRDLASKILVGGLMSEMQDVVTSAIEASYQYQGDAEDTFVIRATGLTLLLCLAQARADKVPLIERVGVVDAAKRAATRHGEEPEIRDLGLKTLWYLSFARYGADWAPMLSLKGGLVVIKSWALIDRMSEAGCLWSALC